MAAAATAAPARAGEIKFEYGKTEVLALRFLSGKEYQGTFGPRVLFSTMDERRFWVDGEDGSDIERRVKELGIEAGDFIAITKVKMARGGGHAFRVERVADQPAEERSELGARLEQSLAIAQAGQRFPAPEVVAGIAQPKPAITENAARLMSCFMDAINAVGEAQAYATRRGLGITFTSEDVRCCALSCYINSCKGGGAR